jgi:hypothetical protein
VPEDGAPIAVLPLVPVLLPTGAAEPLVPLYAAIPPLLA